MALLRAHRRQQRQVIGSVLLEAMRRRPDRVDRRASLAGVGSPVGLKALLGAFGFDIPAGGVVIPRSTDLVVTCLVVGMLVTIVGRCSAGAQASRIPPIAAMRDVAIDRSGTRVCGSLGLAASLVAGGRCHSVARPQRRSDRTSSASEQRVFLGVAVLGPVIARPDRLGVIGCADAPASGGSPATLARENAMRNPKRTVGDAPLR